jgi:hypothetical protein
VKITYFGPPDINRDVDRPGTVFACWLDSRTRQRKTELQCRIIESNSGSRDTYSARM